MFGWPSREVGPEWWEVAIALKRSVQPNSAAMASRRDSSESLAAAEAGRGTAVSSIPRKLTFWETASSWRAISKAINPPEDIPNS